MKEFMVSTSGHALKSHKTYNVFLLTYLFNTIKRLQELFIVKNYIGLEIKNEKKKMDVSIRTKKTKLENKLKTMANRNIIKNTFNTTSEEQASHLKRTIWNSSMIYIPNKSFNILSKGFD